MARFWDVHPVDPQPRVIAKVVELVRGGGLIVYPTDSCFAFGCSLDNPGRCSGSGRSAASTTGTTSR